MLKPICPHYCPAPFCLSSCPAGAITIAGTKRKNIYIDVDKCNGCGICRMICMTWSYDKSLERKLPWISPKVD